MIAPFPAERESAVEAECNVRVTIESGGPDRNNRGGGEPYGCRDRLGIERLVICGTLSNLRSLTAPLAEELDLQVEVLDSLEGIDPDGIPEPRKAFSDTVASLYPACAVATEEGAVNLWPREGSLVRMPRPVAVVGASALATSAAAAAVVSYFLVAAPMTAPAGERGDGRTPEIAAPVVAAKPLAAGRVAKIELAGLVAPPGASSFVASDEPGGQVEDGGAGKAEGERPSANQVQPRTPAPSRRATARAPEVTARADLPPSMPSAKPRVASPAPTLQPSSVLDVVSILLTGDRKLAIVNGRIVSVGDQVGGFAVVEILPSAVLVATVNFPFVATENRTL